MMAMDSSRGMVSLFGFSVANTTGDLLGFAVVAVALVRCLDDFLVVAFDEDGFSTASRT